MGRGWSMIHDPKPRSWAGPKSHDRNCEKHSGLGTRHDIVECTLWVEADSGLRARGSR